MTVRPGSLPFQKQVDFFKQKVPMSSEAWTDLKDGMHARAFVVAGAMKDAVVTDFYKAALKGIEKGTSIQEFRLDYRRIKAAHGWDDGGKPGHRMQTIYHTNLRQSYSTGREEQMQDPELRKQRPYGLYRHGGSETPRKEHLALDGLVLPLDDKFWEEWTPMNGWGCSCKKFMVSEEDAKRMGLNVATAPPAIPRDKVPEGWPGHEEGATIPRGVDLGFAYNPGSASMGRQLAEREMANWRAMKADAWEQLTPGDWRSSGRPANIPADKAKGAKAFDRSESVPDQIRRLIGGEERVFRVPGGLSVNVNSTALGQHMDPSRRPGLGYLPETLEDPFEVWQVFERHQGTGRVMLRHRIVKVLDTGKNSGAVAVAQMHRGQLEAWTFVQTRDLKYLQGQRRGRLLYGR